MTRRKVSHASAGTAVAGRPTLFPLEGRTMHYAWGSTELIPALRGVEPDGRPHAEVWWGTHPAAPSTAQTSTDPLPLTALLAREGRPERLPYLAKLLAAAAPLSLQVHPSTEQARSGWAREEAARVPRDAPARQYPDASHKPEMLFALTPFELLCGFRAPEAVRAELQAFDVPRLDPVIAALEAAPARAAVRAAWTEVLSRPTEEASRTVGDVVAACRAELGSPQSRRLVLDLAETFPGDAGVLAALFLNHVRLRAGQAVFVPSGVVHSYRRGLGVEVMAASDNVLRAGLTPKHVAVEEVLRVVDFEPREPRVLESRRVAPGVRRLAPPVGEFELWVHAVRDAATREPALTAPTGPRVVVACAGRTIVRASGEELVLEQGEAAFALPEAQNLRVSTSGTAVTVAVPDEVRATSPRAAGDSAARRDTRR